MWQATRNLQEMTLQSFSAQRDDVDYGGRNNVEEETMWTVNDLLLNAEKRLTFKLKPS